MSIFIIILAIAFFTFILSALINWSNNIIFMMLKKPAIWIVFMFLLGFSYFLIGSQFSNSYASFNIVWWSAFLALIVNIPGKPSEGLGKLKKQKILNNEDIKKMDDDFKNFIDEIYNDLGIKNGRLKYKIGLFAYVVGGLLGWGLFFKNLVIK